MPSRPGNGDTAIARATEWPIWLRLFRVPAVTRGIRWRVSQSGIFRRHVLVYIDVFAGRDIRSRIHRWAIAGRLPVTVCVLHILGQVHSGIGAVARPDMRITAACAIDPGGKQIIQALGAHDVSPTYGC